MFEFGRDLKAITLNLDKGVLVMFIDVDAAGVSAECEMEQWIMARFNDLNVKVRAMHVVHTDPSVTRFRVIPALPDAPIWTINGIVSLLDNYESKICRVEHIANLDNANMGIKKLERMKAMVEKSMKLTDILKSVSDESIPDDVRDWVCARAVPELNELLDNLGNLGKLRLD